MEELMKRLHLGSRVLVGAEKEEGVVDALTRGAVGVLVEGGRYVVVGWAEVVEA